MTISCSSFDPTSSIVAFVLNALFTCIYIYIYYIYTVYIYYQDSQLNIPESVSLASFARQFITNSKETTVLAGARN